MVPKVIKTAEQYERALARIGTLMEASPGTPMGDELELLATLVEFYEQRAYPIDLPDPIEAIKFRMEQAGLRQRDLEPFIGSRSKVSEVLHGKRPLSLKMVRRLHEGLGIPAEVLLREPAVELPVDHFQCDRFPVAEMAKRGWFSSSSGTEGEAQEYAEDLLRSFFGGLGKSMQQSALPRQRTRSGSTMDAYALLAWRARVLMLANELDLAEFTEGSVTEEFMRQLVSLSYLTEGPRLAREYLGKNGIALVMLRHLPRTHLDGAAMLRQSGHPIVALTLRHDRLDNFWFTLCHELGHVALHLIGSNVDIFVDDLDAEGDGTEKQADEFAGDSLIPRKAWQAFVKTGRRDASSVRLFAESLRIHPAIVAGRVRHEEGNYRILSNLIGRGRVRCQFENIDGAVAPRM